MNINEYTWLLNKPDAVHDKQTDALEKIVQEFPYFQSARALYLKGLYNQNSFKYNYVLKVAAAHTVDRGILFDFITSDTFTSIQKDLYDKKTGEILDITVKESEVVEPRLEQRENTIENSILTSIKESGMLLREESPEMEMESGNTGAPQSKIESIASPSDTKEQIEHDRKTKTQQSEDEIEAARKEVIEKVPAENLEIGKPLAFSTEEKHSFQEWLQLSRLTPISRDETEATDDKYGGEDLEKQKKKRVD